MRVSTVVAAAALVLGLVVFAVHHWMRVPTIAATQHRSSPVVPAVVTARSNPPVQTLAFSVRADKGAGSPAPVSSFKKRYRDAKDYFAFAHSILPDARAGNADAQYYLWAVQYICVHNDSTSHFSTMDQAEQKGASLGVSMEEVHKSWARCHDLLTRDVSDLGDSWDWLDRAVQGGQPVAGIVSAALRLQQDVYKATAGHVPDGFPQTPIGGDAASDPHPLVLKALQSGDPDALLTISSFATHLNPTQPRQQAFIDMWAWTVIACQRGADCSQCGKYCDTTYLMQAAGNQWGIVQQRAQALSQDLDSQQWGQLGLGLSDAAPSE